MRAFWLLGFALLIPVRQIEALDRFDRHTTFWLKEAVKNSTPRSELSSGQAASLKTLGGGSSSPCLIVKTNQGHWTKALVSWGVRRGADNTLTPVLLIERYVTYDNDRPDLALAAGKGVMLFAGFQFNFEIGQVVPDGQGGDIVLGEDKRLRPVGQAQIFALDGSALPPAEQGEKYDPTAHEGVSPRDFSGDWKINADGRWQGTCSLVIDEEGNAQGSYVSDQSKSVYPVRGQISGLPHRLTFDVELANTTQSFEAFLWTKDKSTMAGTTTLAERKFGFYATRLKSDP